MWKSCLLLLVVVCGLPSICLADRLTILHTFVSEIGDVPEPAPELALLGSWVYGVSPHTVVNTRPSIFRVSADGNQFEVVHAIQLYDSFYGSLTRVEDSLYGFSNTGSSKNLFKLDSSGIHIVQSDVDATRLPLDPYGMTASDGLLFGTSTRIFNSPFVYSLRTDGTGYAILHSFGDSDSTSDHPLGDVVVSNGFIYGMYQTDRFGITQPAIYRVATDGSGFEFLHVFDYAGREGGIDYGSHMRQPTIVGTTLYGTMPDFGKGMGTIYRVGIDGSGFEIIHYFKYLVEDTIVRPTGNLVNIGTNLYGLATRFNPGDVVLYRIGVDGSGFEVLQTFDGFAVRDGDDEYNQLVTNGSSIFGILKLSDNGITSHVMFSYAVPEPGSAALVGIALGMLFVYSAVGQRFGTA